MSSILETFLKKKREELGLDIIGPTMSFNDYKKVKDEEKKRNELIDKLGKDLQTMRTPSVLPNEKATSTDVYEVADDLPAPAGDTDLTGGKATKATGTTPLERIGRLAETAETTKDTIAAITANRLANTKALIANQALFKIGSIDTKRLLDYSNGSRGIQNSLAVKRLEMSEPAKTIPAVAVMLNEIKNGTYKGTEEDIQKILDYGDNTAYAKWYNNKIAPTVNRAKDTQKANQMLYGNAGNLINTVSSGGAGILDFVANTALGGPIFGGAMSGLSRDSSGNIQQMRNEGLEQVARDIGVDTSLGGLFAYLMGEGTGAINSAIQSSFPQSVLSKAGIIAKNVISGAGGAYSAVGATGTLRNIYNKLQGRNVTPEEAIKPWWSTETAMATFLGALFHGINGTQSDLAKAEQIKAVMSKQGELNAKLSAYQRDIARQFETNNPSGVKESYANGKKAIEDFFKQNDLGKVTNTIRNEYLKQWFNENYDMGVTFEAATTPNPQGYTSSTQTMLPPTTGGSNVNTGVGPVMPTQGTPTQTTATSEVENLTEESLSKPIDRQLGDRLPSFKKAYVEDLPLSKKTQKEIYTSVYNETLNRIYNQTSKSPDVLEAHDYWNTAIKTIPGGLSDVANSELNNYISTDVPYFEHSEKFLEGWETLVWRAVANAYKEFASENGLDVADDINLDNPYTTKGTDIYGNKIGTSTPKATYTSNNGKMVNYAMSKDDYSTKPPEGKIRLYTNTPFSNIDSILEKGILHEGGKLFRKPSQLEYEGDAIWLENRPDLRGYGGTTIAVDIKPSNNLKKVNDTQYMLYEDIKPEDIVFIDRPLATDGGDPYRTSDIKGFIDEFGAKEVKEVFSEMADKAEQGIGNYWSIPKQELLAFINTLTSKGDGKDILTGKNTNDKMKTNMGGVNDGGSNTGILGQKDDKTLWEGMEVQDEAGASRGRLKSWKHAASPTEAWEGKKEIDVPDEDLKDFQKRVRDEFEKEYGIPIKYFKYIAQDYYGFTDQNGYVYLADLLTEEGTEYTALHELAELTLLQAEDKYLDELDRTIDVILEEEDGFQKYLRYKLRGKPVEVWQYYNAHNDEMAKEALCDINGMDKISKSNPYRKMLEDAFPPKLISTIKKMLDEVIQKTKYYTIPKGMTNDGKFRHFLSNDNDKNSEEGSFLMPKNLPEKPKGLRKKQTTADNRKYLEGLTDEQITKLEEIYKSRKYVIATGQSFELDELLADNKYLDMNIQAIRDEGTRLREKERYNFNYNMEYRNAHPKEWKELKKEISKNHLASKIITDLWINQTPNWRDKDVHIPENASIKSLTSGKPNKFTGKKKQTEIKPTEKKEPDKTTAEKKPALKTETKSKGTMGDDFSKRNQELEKITNELRDKLAKQEKDYEKKLAKKDEEIKGLRAKTKEQNLRRKVRLEAKKKKDSEERRFKSATPKGKLRILGRKIEKQTGYYEINNFPELDEVYEREFGKTIRQTIETLHSRDIFPYLPAKMQDVINTFKDETYLKANWKTFDKYLREALDIDELTKLIEGSNMPVANKLLERIKAHKTAPITIKSAREMYDDLTLLQDIVDVATERMSYKRQNEDIEKTLTKATDELATVKKIRNPKSYTDMAAKVGKAEDLKAKLTSLPQYLSTRIQMLMAGNPDSSLKIIWDWFKEGNEKEMELDVAFARNFDKFAEKAPGGGWRYVKDLEKDFSKDAKPIDTGIKGSTPNGKKYEENAKLTKDIIMHIVASSRNQDNLMSFCKILLGQDFEGNPVYSEPGGYIVPNQYWVERGNLEKAYIEGKKYVFTMDEIKHLESLLTQTEKDFVDAALNVGKLTSKYGNEVSQKLVGRDIFTVDNYIRIIRDPNTLDQELIDPAKLENLANAMSKDFVGIEGILGRGGSLEARNHRSTRPIYGESLLQSVTNSFKGTKKYIAYAIPLYDTDMLLKSKQPDTFRKVATVDKKPRSTSELRYQEVDELPRNGASHTRYYIDSGGDYAIYEVETKGKSLRELINDTGDKGFYDYYNNFVDNLLGRGKKYSKLSSLRAKVVLNANLRVAATQFFSYFQIGQFLEHPARSMFKGLIDKRSIYSLAKDYLESKGEEVADLKDRDVINKVWEEVTFLNTFRGLGYSSADVSYIEAGSTVLGRVNNGALMKAVDRFTVDATFRTLAEDLMSRGFEFGTPEFFNAFKQELYAVYQSNPQYAKIYKTPLQTMPYGLGTALSQFNTVMIEGYNNVIQARMAEEYYKKAGDKANRKKASKWFRNALLGLATGGILLVMMRDAVDRAMGKDKDDPYVQRIFGEFVKNMLSYTIVGDEIFAAIMKKDNYDLTTNELSYAQNVLDTLGYFGAALIGGKPSDMIKAVKGALQTVGVPSNGIENIFSMIGNATNLKAFKAYQVLKDSKKYEQYLKNEDLIDGDIATFYDMKKVMTEKVLTEYYGYVKGSKAGTYSSKASAKSRAIRDVLGFSETKQLNKKQQEEYSKWYEVFKNS